MGKKEIAVLAAAACLMAAAPSWGQEGQTDQEERPWWGTVETGFIFDNNVLGTKAEKESDRIWESMLYLAYQPDQIKWSGRAILDRYQKNDELSYETYEIGAERLFGERDYGGIFLYLSPTAPLDKQDPNREPFSLGSHGFTLLADRDTDRWGNIGLAFSYARLDYQAPFDAKDTDLIAFGPSLFYRIDDQWSLDIEYTYETGAAAGGTIPGDSGGVEDDISYQVNALSLKVTRLLSDKTGIRLRYKIRRKRFTADDRDPVHAGRRDTNHFFYAEIEHRLSEEFLLLGRLERIWRRSTDSFVEFNENRLAVSAAYHF